MKTIGVGAKKETSKTEDSKLKKENKELRAKVADLEKEVEALGKENAELKDKVTKAEK